MVTPAAGAVHFLHVRPGQDAARAARRMRAPSDAARELMANGGVVPGSLAAGAGDGHDDPRPTEVVAPAATPVAPAVDTGAHARGGRRRSSRRPPQTAPARAAPSPRPTPPQG